MATSKNLIPEYLEYWARIKGINVVGTGDCVHPGWLKELKEKFEPAGNGLYRLKNEHILSDSKSLRHPDIPDEVFFILTGEISSIYKKDGSVRKVHNVCVFPDFNAVEKLQQRLEKIGNITSDGRPILGLDSRDLLEMALESSETSFLFPAHIWTPWFSVLGSKSGFDTVEECYGDLSGHIFAAETGLSSDPAMNWACSFLDKYSLVSNSDAHSPEKLGREANIFDTGISYNEIREALKTKNGFLGTIEFFPQEGKYHYDGHRKCNTRWDPLETVRHNGVCPVCNKPVTIGVMYRVAELADRADISEAVNKKEFYSITPLPDILSELFNVSSSSSKKVKNEYGRLIKNLGSEFHILLSAETDAIRSAGGDVLAGGIGRLRRGDVIIEEGFDGEFGRIKVFNKDEIGSCTGTSLFSGDLKPEAAQGNKARSSVRFNIAEFQELYQKSGVFSSKQEKSKQEYHTTGDQVECVQHFTGPCMALAGPGSGKTWVLTERIANLITNKNIQPENIMAATFSNKAALEIRGRLDKINNGKNVNVTTFHAFGLSVLKNYFERCGRGGDFYIADDAEREEIAERISGGSKALTKKILKRIEAFKQGQELAEADEETERLASLYDRELQRLNAFDLDDLIYIPVVFFRLYPEILSRYRKEYPWILVDEFQDINFRQYEFIRLLAGDGEPNLFVIGDPDQAIYGFRGSDVRFIERLKEDYASIRIINLGRSYRCPTPVLKLAGQILGKTEFLPGNPDEIKAQIQQCETDRSEADWIAAQIERMMGGVRSFSIDSGISDGEADVKASGFSDFCVLCRSTFMFEPLVKAFHDHGIAYQVIGSAPFYQAEPFYSFIKLLKLAYYGRQAGDGLAETKIKIRKMMDSRDQLSDIINITAAEMNLSGDDRERLASLALGFGNNYEEFFRQTVTRQAIDDYDSKKQCVSLMTIHASKGLEFNAVFIPGCEEGIMPFELFGKKSDAEIGEEERLFYVGITRTKKYIFLSHAQKRIYRGRLLEAARSHFLDRVEKGLLLFGKRDGRRKGNGEVQLNMFGE